MENNLKQQVNKIKPRRVAKNKKEVIKEEINQLYSKDDEIKTLRETLRKIVDKIGYEGFEEFLKYDENIRSIKDKIK